MIFLTTQISLPLAKITLSRTGHVHCSQPANVPLRTE